MLQLTKIIKDELRQLTAQYGQPATLKFTALPDTKLGYTYTYVEFTDNKPKSIKHTITIDLNKRDFDLAPVPIDMALKSIRHEYAHVLQMTDLYSTSDRLAYIAEASRPELSHGDRFAKYAYVLHVPASPYIY